MELLQRLRDPFKVTPQDAAEAADEIERLREDLWKIMMAYPEESYAHVIAKSALRQKESK